MSEVHYIFPPIEFISGYDSTAIPMLIRQQSSGQSHCQGRLKLVMTHVLCEIIGTLGNIFARQDPLLVHSVLLLWGATLKLSGEYSRGAFKYVLSNNRWNLERDQSPLLIKIIVIRLIKVFWYIV